MKITVSQLRRIIKEEVQRTLLEQDDIDIPVFQVGDIVRTKIEGANVPLSANPSFRESPMRTASLASHQDVEVLDVADDRGDQYVLIELPSGDRGWALSYNLAPADDGPSRKGAITLYAVDIFTKNPPPGKYLRTVQVRATSDSEAKAIFQSKNKLKPGEYIEIAPHAG